MRLGPQSRRDLRSFLLAAHSRGRSVAPGDKMFNDVSWRLGSEAGTLRKLLQFTCAFQHWDPHPGKGLLPFFGTLSTLGRTVIGDHLVLFSCVAIEFLLPCS